MVCKISVIVPCYNQENTLKNVLIPWFPKHLKIMKLS